MSAMRVPGTGILVAVLVERFVADATVAELADDYDLPGWLVQSVLAGEALRRERKDEGGRHMTMTSNMKDAVADLVYRVQTPGQTYRSDEVVDAIENLLRRLNATTAERDYFAAELRVVKDALEESGAEVARLRQEKEGQRP